ncbi:FAD-binding oxidoreductase [Actinoplanes sp. TRM 88003]|uniref:FAD-binding oxidoreductase n=1 Tax=Paractinoplanes aksuensis TaxID=2939490 RepID=A0ABT1DS11_9ACTN|nr:FAD-binding oxidoreductase [Actinoplanes aksuensis]MCO8273620.1 FAD-binding oxidoreductase [Actinoplanes aksuensis]
MSTDWWPAEVVQHDRRSPDIAVFRCRTLRPLPFRAGQHVPIECPYLPWRSAAYSMANAPRLDRVLEFHVRAPDRADGVSAALVHRLKPGDTLRLGAPRGSLTLDPYSRRDLVFVPAGTGLAPAKALIEELSRFNRTRWIHLFRGEPDDPSFYDRRALDLLAERHPWLTITRARAGLADLVAAHGPWPDHDFYVSGPPAAVAAIVHRLESCRVPPTRIRYDDVALKI